MLRKKYSNSDIINIPDTPMAKMLSAFIRSALVIDINAAPKGVTFTSLSNCASVCSTALYMSAASSLFSDVSDDG